MSLLFLLFLIASGFFGGLFGAYLHKYIEEPYDYAPLYKYIPFLLLNAAPMTVLGFLLVSQFQLWIIIISGIAIIMFMATLMFLTGTVMENDFDDFSCLGCSMLMFSFAILIGIIFYAIYYH